MSFHWFVSRERLTEKQEEIAQLKEERRILLDRIAELSGQRPLYTEAPEPAELPAYISTGKRSTGRLTLAQAQEMAKINADKDALSGISPVREMVEKIRKRI